MEILDYIKASDDTIHHMPYAAFLVKDFLNPNVAIFLLKRLVLKGRPALDFLGVLENIVLLGDVVGVLFFGASLKTVLVDHLNDGQVFSLVILGNGRFDVDLSHKRAFAY